MHQVIEAQGGMHNYLCLRVIRNIAQYNAATKGCVMSMLMDSFDPPALDL